jgi:multidrug resistance efflux pump
MNLGDFVRAAGYRPSLRNDIKFYKGKQDVVVVHDPVRDRRFEMYETECMIAREMNGTRDLDAITRLAQKHVPWATRIHVEKLAIQFAGMGLLSDIPAAILARPSVLSMAQIEPVFKPPSDALLDYEIPPDRSDGLDDWTELADPAVLDTITAPDPIPPPINPIIPQDADSPFAETTLEPFEPEPPVRRSGNYAAYSKHLVRRTPQRMAAVAPPDESITPVVPRPDENSITPVVPSQHADDNTATPVGTRAPTPPPDGWVKPSERRAVVQTPRRGHPVAPPQEQAPWPEHGEPDVEAPPPPPPPVPVPAPPPPPVEVKPEPKREPKKSNDEAWEIVKPSWYRRHPKKTVLLFLLLVVAILGVIPYPLYVTETCVITPSTYATVRVQIDGILAEVLVKEGDKVGVGTPLAKLDDRDLVYSLRQAEANVERVTATLAKVRSGNRPEEIRRAKAQLSAKAQEVKFASIEAKRQQKLFKQGVASAADRDEAVRDLGVKRSQLAEAAAELKLIESGSRSEEVTIAEADLRKAEAEVAFLQKKMADLVITSPIAGHVLTPKLHERLHERIAAGGELCEIGASDVMRVEVLVPEQEADVVKLGQPVEVKVKSYPLEVFTGKVNLIAPAVVLHEGRRILRVEAEVQNKNNLLRPRMTGYAEIDTGDRTVLGRLVRSAVRWVRVRFLI